MFFTQENPPQFGGGKGDEPQEEKVRRGVSQVKTRAKNPAAIASRLPRENSFFSCVFWGTGAIWRGKANN